ncbi:MAG TPA: GSCFA domain protein [Bacteroidetes bacterium]|nr:GSCFA domain protein [Bacteroidota bacterium]
MTSFRTEIPPTPSSLKVTHRDAVLCIGSCFAEHMGARLERLKFPVLLNPFGIVYNPVSVAQALELLLSERGFGEADLFHHLGLWHSFAHHGQFSHPEKKVALSNINRSLGRARLFLKKANRLILTLGTANVFVLKKTGEVVANCHKMPGQEFARKRLSVGEVAQRLILVLGEMKERLPALEVIVSVSPVRHLRDGLTENQKSKATLLLGLEEVCRAHPFVHYFPAYEMVLDDLRDYRFYKKDLAHPNEMAVDYVWQHFENAFFDEKTSALCQRIERIKTAAEHRPLHPSSAAHQAFLRKQIKAVEALGEAYPFLDFTEELKVFAGQIG